VGLKEIEDALNKIQATKTMNAVALLVTTRTMGFCASQIYFHASKQRTPVYCDIYAFYRINLSMFEARLYYIRRKQELPMLNFQQVYDVSYRPEYLRVTATINPYPDQIGRVLKALGPINEGDEYFIPALAADQRSRQGSLILQSECVTFSNLRETVVALANPATNPQVRETSQSLGEIEGDIKFVRVRVKEGTVLWVSPGEAPAKDHSRFRRLGTDCSDIPSDRPKTAWEMRSLSVEDEERTGDSLWDQERRPPGSRSSDRGGGQGVGTSEIFREVAQDAEESHHTWLTGGACDEDTVARALGAIDTLEPFQVKEVTDVLKSSKIISPLYLDCAKTTNTSFSSTIQHPFRRGNALSLMR
jgi:hypothetical protein